MNSMSSGSPLQLQTMRGAAGFTLVEIMVGLVLSLIIMFALSVLFVNNSRTRTQIDDSTQQIENGRYALDVLRDDLHLAGFYGEIVPQQGYVTASATTPSTCATTIANLQFNLSPLQWPVPVFGVAGGDATPACVTSPGRKAGTDILVVRRTKTVATPIASLDASRIYVQASGCGDELKQHKDFARDTGANPGTFALRKKGCANAADVYEFETRVYYVSDEQLPTLRVLTLSGTASSNEPIVEGIEDMRVEYGRDTGTDGSADEYRKCLSVGVGADPCTSAQWANMVAARIYLLARNVNPTSGYSDTKTYAMGTGVNVGPFNDQYKRHLYSTVIRLMNPAGLRERT